MSFSRWQKLSERMTAKVVLLAEAVEREGAAAGAAPAAPTPAAMVLSLMALVYQPRLLIPTPRRQASVA
jgi:hypothetical protein